MTDLTAVARCCDRIRKRAADPRLVLVPGLADDLRLIGEAFVWLEQGQRTIASCVLAKHYGYSATKTDYHHLVELAQLEDSACPNATNPSAP